MKLKILRANRVICKLIVLVSLCTTYACKFQCFIKVYQWGGVGCQQMCSKPPPLPPSKLLMDNTMYVDSRYRVKVTPGGEEVYFCHLYSPLGKEYKEKIFLTIADEEFKLLLSYKSLYK